MKYLLDTAPWINGVTLPEVLPRRIRRLLGRDDMKGLSSVSLLETAILYRLGRLKLDGALEEFFAVGLSADLQLLELNAAIASRTNELPDDFPGDPFDRTIVYYALNFSKLFGRQAVILGQLKIWFQPKLCLTVAAVYMNVYPALLAGEKEKAIPFVAKHRWAHKIRLLRIYPKDRTFSRSAGRSRIFADSAPAAKSTCLPVPCIGS